MKITWVLIDQLILCFPTPDAGDSII